jgi:hypothetical protein
MIQRILAKLILLVVGFAVMEPAHSFATVDSCQGIKQQIRKVKSRIAFKKEHKLQFLKKKKLIKRLRALRAAKVSQGCSVNSSLPAIDPISNEGELICIQSLVCRIVDGEIVIWPDPCVAAAERPDFESLPFC